MKNNEYKNTNEVKRQLSVTSINVKSAIYYTI